MVISLGDRLPWRSCSLPETHEKAGRFPSPEGGIGLCLALLRPGVAWPRHYGRAGGLLHHLFTLALAGGMSLWPDPAGSSEESPPRELPGGVPCGERTFLEAQRLRDHLTSLELDNTRKHQPRQRLL